MQTLGGDGAGRKDNNTPPRANNREAALAAAEKRRQDVGLSPVDRLPCGDGDDELEIEHVCFGRTGTTAGDERAEPECGKAFEPARGEEPQQEPRAETARATGGEHTFVFVRCGRVAVS